MTVSIKKEPNRVFIIDNQPVYTTGLVSILSEAGFEICGTSDDYTKSLSQVKKKYADIVVMDIFIKNLVWSDFIVEMKNALPEIRILVLSMLDESVYPEKVLKAGASGFLSKTSSPGSVIEAINTILRGELYLSRDVSSSILRRYMSGGGPGSGPEFLLSERELEVFTHLGTGLTSKEIAKKIGVSSKTVDNHKASIKEKMSYKNFLELAQAAVLWQKKKNGIPGD